MQNQNSAVNPTANSAAELEEIVKNRLSGRVQDFQLAVQNGGIVLRGNARTFYAKQLAQHIVMEATTVPILANEINVLCEEQP